DYYCCSYTNGRTWVF
nr:immunoglobulin light chain junction region [Macaca mulatta]